MPLLRSKRKVSDGAPLERALPGTPKLKAPKAKKLKVKAPKLAQAPKAKSIKVTAPKPPSGAEKALKSAPKPGQARKIANAKKVAPFQPPKPPKQSHLTAEPSELKSPVRPVAPGLGQPGQRLADGHAPGQSPRTRGLEDGKDKLPRPPGKLKRKAMIEAIEAPTPPLHPAFAEHVRPPS